MSGVICAMRLVWALMLRQIVRKMAVQIATEKSRGNTTITVPVHPAFADSLRAARAAGITGAEVFIGKIVKGCVLPMNKKAWAAKLCSVGRIRRCRRITSLKRIGRSSA